MSNQNDREKTIDCPKCEQPVHATPETVLRPGEPAVLQLFQGELNNIVCPSCGAKFFLDVPLLYRDDPKHFLIYFMPLSNPQEWQKAEEEMAVVIEHIFAELLEEDGIALPDCRLAVTRKSFIEKIALHMDDLDDLIVEYIKYQLYQNEEEQIDPIRHELLYDFSQKIPDALPLIVFDRENGQACASMHISLELYQEIKDAVNNDEVLQEELNSLFPGYFVSVERLL